VVSACDHYELILGDQFYCEPGISEFFPGTFDKTELHFSPDYGADDLGRVTSGNHQRDPWIGLVSLARLEPGEVDPRASTLMLVHNALTDAEIEFPSADVGVRLESR
jgi:hypothetical protein